MAAMTETEEIRAKILQLSDMLDKEHPGMKVWLRQIHKGLKDNEAAVHALSEEEIAVIVGAYSKSANMELAATITKGKSSGQKALKGISADDL